MNRMTIAIKLNIKNNIKSKIAIAFTLGLNIFIIGISLIVTIKMLLIPAISRSDAESVRRYYSLLLFGICLTGSGLCANVFTGGFLMGEKPSRIYESLLATPLTVKELWMAKVISVYIPALVFAELITAAAFVFIQYRYINPALGNILSPVDFLSIFMIMPLIYLFVISLAFLIGLYASSMAGNAIIQLFLPVYAQISINIAARTVISSTPMNFLVFNTGFVVITIIPVFLFLPKLTKENVVLSARKK